MTERCAYCGSSVALDSSMAAHLRACRLYYPGSPTRAERLGFTAKPAVDVKQNDLVKQKGQTKRGRPRTTPEGFDRNAYMRDYMRRKRSQKASKDSKKEAAAFSG